jgi:aminoglycoside phosphotransferase family enzyme
MDIDFKKADKVIETLLSRIFFFGEKVFKFYKWQNAFYGNLADETFRKQFIAEDFYWNNAMSPEVYKEMILLKNESGKEDFCIVMQRLNNLETFTDFAEKKKLTPNLLNNFVELLILKQRKIAEDKKSELQPLLSRALKEIEVGEIEDFRSLGYMAKDFIPTTTTDRFADKLLLMLDSDEYRKWAEIAKKSACIDGNGDNIILNNNISFIDILPPKYNWRVKDEAMNLCRASADIQALGENKGLADGIYAKYAELSGLNLPPLIRKLYEIRGAMIQAAYRNIIKQKERGDKYLAFAKREIKEV